MNSLRKWQIPASDRWQLGTRTKSGAIVISRTLMAGSENHDRSQRKIQCLSDTEGSCPVATSEFGRESTAFMLIVLDFDTMKKFGRHASGSVLHLVRKATFDCVETLHGIVIDDVVRR